MAASVVGFIAKKGFAVCSVRVFLLVAVDRMLCPTTSFFVLSVVVAGCYRLLLTARLQFAAFGVLSLFWVAGWLSLIRQSVGDVLLASDEFCLQSGLKCKFYAKKLWLCTLLEKRQYNCDFLSIPPLFIDRLLSLAWLKPERSFVGSFVFCTVVWLAVVFLCIWQRFSAALQKTTYTCKTQHRKH